MTGDWDAAEGELTQAIDADDLGDAEHIRCCRAWMAALRGDTATAQAALAGLRDMRASEDVQDQEKIVVVEAFTAAARRQPATALRHARAALDQADVVGISHEYLRWAWPLAARAAHDLADTAAAAESAGHARRLPARAAGPHAARRSATWPAPGSSPPTPTQPPVRRSPPRSPGCASIPPPTTSPTACWTTPPTCCSQAMTRPPPPRPAKPVASPGGCAASR